MVVLIATMDNDNIQELLKKMNLSNTDTIVVNQYKNGREQAEVSFNGKALIVDSDRLGLSASRNEAIYIADKDAICQLADDDMTFVDDYEKILALAYEEFPDADIIVFYVDNEDKAQAKQRMKKGRIRHVGAMKTSSVQISFKRASLVDNNIQFDERFGIGGKYGSGEENILLFDALRKGLKIYSYPIKVATLINDRDSHWDRSVTPEFCEKKGAIFKRMSPMWYWLIILQFCVRKRQMLKEVGLLPSIRLMFKGAKEFKRSAKNPQ